MMVNKKSNYISASERIDAIVDEGQFQSLKYSFKSTDRLNFPNYAKKLAQEQAGDSTKEAVVSGIGRIGGFNCVLLVFDPTFFVGSVNTTVGDIIKLTIKQALQSDLPLVTITASAGARMQEGIFSLIEFSSILFEWAKLQAAKVPTINILTDPTLGGVSASFAFAADYQFAQTESTIGFAGKRVIQSASVDKNEQQPIQDSELLYQNGQFDGLLAPDEIRPTLIQLLSLHSQYEVQGG